MSGIYPPPNYDGSDFKLGDIVEVPCIQCGKPVRLAWTSSCIGWAIMHGSCREQFLKSSTQ